MGGFDFTAPAETAETAEVTEAAAPPAAAIDLGSMDFSAPAAAAPEPAPAPDAEAATAVALAEVADQSAPHSSQAAIKVITL